MSGTVNKHVSKGTGGAGRCLLSEHMLTSLCLSLCGSSQGGADSRAGGYRKFPAHTPSNSKELSLWVLLPCSQTEFWSGDQSRGCRVRSQPLVNLKVRLIGWRGLVVSSLCPSVAKTSGPRRSSSQTRESAKVPEPSGKYVPLRKERESWVFQKAWKRNFSLFHPHWTREMPCFAIC